LDELTEAQSRYLLQQTTIDVIEWLVEIFPLFWSYSQPRQVALIDLGFNVGQGSFIRFKLMISAILQGNWAEASRQMLHSEWASQVGQRAIQDSNWIGNG
jgi:GH24 family phage-related lysozyme (muramidase)